MLAEAGLLMAAVCQPASALISPIPIATDARIKTIMYAPNEVYKFTGYYGYQTIIQFAQDEEIGTISIGDPSPWQVTPSGNRLFIKPIEKDATTNMTLITNKRTYFFELRAGNAKDVTDTNITFELNFVYPGEDNGVSQVSSIDKVPDLAEEDLSKYNFKYTITGSDDIAPIRIFDDGEFTYFQFHDVNADIPAFYQVDKNGNEALINYRTRGPYIVVERVAARYTLRHGIDVLCVFNESWGTKRMPKPDALGGLFKPSTSHSTSP